MSRKPTKPARLYQQVAEQLARTIAAGTYKLGDRLPAERELAAAHSVSRPTIREAIIALELDGLVEVKVGSGVYVTKRKASAGEHVPMDVGAFELTEARLAVEGEAAALAAKNISDDELATLDLLLREMEGANRKSVGAAEIVDRDFHELIAHATGNSALEAMVQQLWTIRNRSPQCIRLFEKSRDRGTSPVIAEHRAIVDALKAHDSAGARAAMRSHLSRVLNYLLDATEVEAIEEAKARMARQRTRFAAVED